MKLQHTPGPWRVGDAGHTVFGPPNGNPSPHIIADIHGRAGYPGELRANARLIASAPTMAELLALALRYLEHPDAQAIPFALSVDVPAGRIRAVLADLALPPCGACSGTGVKTDSNGIQSDDVCPECDGAEVMR